MSDIRLIYSKRNRVFYDLYDGKDSYIRITPESYSLKVPKSNGKAKPFLKGGNTRVQITPEMNMTINDSIKYLFEMAESFFGLKGDPDKYLFISYLISCLLPNMVKSILVLNSHNGMDHTKHMAEQIKKLIDPGRIMLYKLPTTNTKTLKCTLDNNYMSVFYETGALIKWQHSMIESARCSNPENYIEGSSVFNQRRCIIFCEKNLIYKSDRSNNEVIYLNLKPKKKADGFIITWDKALGSIFCVLQLVLAKLDNPTIDDLSIISLGNIIVEIADSVCEEKAHSNYYFKSILKTNHTKQYKTVFNNTDICMALHYFYMGGDHKKGGNKKICNDGIQITDLLKELQKNHFYGAILPKNSIAFSRQLHNLKDLFKKNNYKLDFKHFNKGSMVKISTIVKK